jgi:hypothetical protein
VITICAHGAFPVAKVLVGLGHSKTPQIFVGWSKNNLKNKVKKEKK